MILLKRLLITLLLIASISQAMAGVMMPYQMNMTTQGVTAQTMATQGHCMGMDMSDSDQAMQVSCSDEHDCCSGVCSLSFIASAILFTGAKTIQTSVQHIENSVIATTSTLYRPPILA